MMKLKGYCNSDLYLAEKGLRSMKLTFQVSGTGSSTFELEISKKKIHRMAGGGGKEGLSGGGRLGASGQMKRPFWAYRDCGFWILKNCIECILGLGKDLQTRIIVGRGIVQE